MTKPPQATHRPLSPRTHSFHTIYDGEGKRVRKYVGENTRFVYGIGGELLAEYNGSTGSITKEYLYGASGLAAVIDPSNGTEYLTPDHLGSPRVVTNASATVTQRRDFMPFGEEVTSGAGRSSGNGWSSAAEPRQKFTGYEKDAESGFDFAQARYYASGVGRFNAIDPLGESARKFQPQSWNRYSYVLNNPIRYIDPSGEDYEDLSEKQKKLINDWAARENTANGTNLTAQAIYDALAKDRRAAFESIANALENTTIVGKDGSRTNGIELIKSISLIVGEKPAGKDDAPSFRIFVDLTDNAQSIMRGAKEFKPSNPHGEFSESYQQRGGAPGLQVSMTADGKRADIDVDYESKKWYVVAATLCLLHCKESNSDVRHKKHFEAHNKRYGTGSAGPLTRRYEPKNPK